MTDAKHEAPAEGAGEVLDAAEQGRLAAAINMLEQVAENNETVRLYGKEVAVLLKALRARSSAPEALGNLLAVIHRDGGHRTLEVGVEQAAAEAEKVVANLLSSAPEAREGEAVAWRYKAKFSDLAHSHWHYTDRDPSAAKTITNVQPLYAAPSADKLRIAGDALDRIATVDMGGGFLGADACRQVARKALIALRDASTPDALKGDAK